MPLTKKQKLECLRSVTLFSGVSARGVSAIADLAQDAEFPAGAYIVREGQVGTGFYVIDSGKVAVEHCGRSLATLGRGQTFGEMSLVGHGPRVAHVRALEPSTVLGIAFWDLMKLLEDHPKVALALLQQLARRLRAAEPSIHH